MKRFILTVNNKIIDTSKYSSCEVKNSTSGKKLEVEVLTKDGIAMLAVYKIIKESDSIVDLIEVGDLITYKLTGTTSPIYYGEIASITIDRNGKTIRTSTDTIDEILTILKIYKPNQNRGYDLAWECEE